MLKKIKKYLTIFFESVSEAKEAKAKHYLKSFNIRYYE